MKMQNRIPRIAVTLAWAMLVLWLICGCSSPEEKAQQLFGQGKFEEVVQKYPDTKVAEQAKEKLAENLYNEGKYDEVLKSYAQTPIAPKARTQLDAQSAKKLFDARDYEGVLKQYSSSQIAPAARDSLAQKLYGDMYANPDGWEKLYAQYPNIADPSPRSRLATEEFERIMRMPDKGRKEALMKFVQDPKFERTLADARARKELAKSKK